MIRRTSSVVCCLFFAALVAQVAAATQMTATTPGGLERRPSPAETSPLQARIAGASPGSTVEVGQGRYDGDLVIDRPLHLVGKGRPRLVGSGAGSVVRIRADDVSIEGFDIDGREGGSVSNDSSGVHVAAKRAVIRDVRITHALFGVYLREADGARVNHISVEGLLGRDPGDQGSGIHVWNTNGFTLTNNAIRNTRDGLYIQQAPNGFIAHNVARDLRYGLHYMYADDNVFEDNTFENGAAGAAVMYSRRIVFRRNRFLNNRGYASVGLLMQGCDDVVAEDNLIANNARGLFLEGTYRDIFRRNIIADSDTALIIFGSVSACRFEGNSFIGNFSPLELIGRRTDTVFSGNYWSDDTEPDLDGDGIRDQPYRLSNVFDHFRGNLLAADLFAQGLAADVLARAERVFPVLEPISVVDARSLARPPKLGDVPKLPVDASQRAPWGLAISALGLGTGLTALLSGRRRSARVARPS